MSVEDGIPEAGQATPESAPTQDWEKDYKALQAEYTRSQQTLKSFESDPNALISFIQDKHPDLLAEDDEEEDTYVEPDEDEQPLTRAEWKQWQAEQEQASKAQSAQAQFETDFKEFVGDRALSTQGDAFVRYAATKGDIKGPDDLRKTIDDWFAYEDGLKTAAKAKPRVPHVPANGQAATEVPDWSGMSRAERDRYMAEKAQGLLQQ